MVRPLTLLSLGSGHILTEALLILLFFPSENDRLKMVEAGKWQLPGQVKVLLLSFHFIHRRSQPELFSYRRDLLRWDTIMSLDCLKSSWRSRAARF